MKQFHSYNIAFLIFVAGKDVNKVEPSSRFRRFANKWRNKKKTDEAPSLVNENPSAEQLQEDQKEEKEEKEEHVDNSISYESRILTDQPFTSKMTSAI